jgi:hypothetical protein
MEPSVKVRWDSAEDDPEVLVGGTPVEIEDAGDVIFARCEISDMENLFVTPLPENLILQMWDGGEALPYPFSEIRLSSGSESAVDAILDCHHPNKYWEHRWGFAAWLEAVERQVVFHPTFDVVEVDVEDDWKQLSLKTELLVGATYGAALSERAAELQEIIREAEIALGGFTWRDEYDTDEALFSTEVLTPLLRRMDFENVRCRHGTREYGKDFTFSEPTKFGTYRHYGLQAKAGDIKGSVNAEIDEIIGQLDDAFKMPYHELSSTEARYISTFIVAISGRFTENAQEKIIKKIAHGLHGSVYFLSGEQIRELIERYWS